MEILSKIFDYVTNNKNKRSHKAATFITIIILAVAIDNIFSFSYYYNLSRKSETLTALVKLSSDTTLSKADKNHINDLLSDAVNHSTFKDWLYDNVGHLKSTVYTGLSHQKQNIIHYLTSNWFIIFISLVLNWYIIKPMFKVKKSIFDDSPYEVFLKLLVVDACSIVLTLFISKLLLYVPIFFGNRIYNYGLYFSLNTSLLLYFSYDKKTKKFDFSLKE